MNLRPANVLLPLTIALSSSLLAQGQHMLFTTMQAEQTVSGSGGTVLSTILPNEIAVVEFGSACAGLSAEKWAPRTMFHTQAGDTDGDDAIFESNLFGRIDAVIAGLPGMGPTNQRTVYYSVSETMGAVVSGLPAFRPGDVARIARTGAGLDGQIQYFLRQGDLQTALGLPATAPPVNIDACAWGPNFGVFFSLEEDVVCTLGGVATLVQDGDILVIPPAALAWSPNLTVASTALGGAVVVHTEAAVDLMVQNARITDRNGVCQNQIIDTDALEIDRSVPATTVIVTAGVTILVPELIFAGESLTGGGVLNTAGGGTIHVEPCGPLGTNCTFGPTFGHQVGLKETSAAQGMPSSLNAIAKARVCRFVTQPQQHQVPVGTPIALDIASPGALTWILLSFAPAGPGAVSPSQPFPWGFLCYPDYYALPTVVLGPIPTPTGFGTYTTPVIPWPVDFVMQAVTITPSGAIEASTPSTVEVF